MAKNSEGKKSKNRPAEGKKTKMPPVPKTITVNGQKAPVYLPFYYASLHNIWLFFKADPAALKRQLRGTGFAPYMFGDMALCNINFQNYTGHGGVMLETVNEVEFNAMAYPTARKSDVPKMTLENYLIGEDQTKTIGNLRLHVPADNEFAVAAGIAFFNEPKFYASFNYNVPALNNPDQKTWEFTCTEPSSDGGTTPGPEIFSVSADLRKLDPQPANQNPVVEYGVLQNGRPIGANWEMLGMFDAYPKISGAHKRVQLKTGNSCSPMVSDLRRLLGPKPRCVAAQTFTSQPAAVEPRCYYVDLP